MPRTQIGGEQVWDQTIRRADLNVDDSGDAVVRRIVAGVGIYITEDGADTGTGDVTVNADPVAQVDAVQRIPMTLEGKVNGGGASYLTHDGQIFHSAVPIILANDYELQQVSIAVNTSDGSRDYVIRVYDISGAPSLVATILTLSSGSDSDSATGLTVSLPSGEYGFTIERTSGSGSSSFNKVVVSVLIVEV